MQQMLAQQGGSLGVIKKHSRKRHKCKNTRPNTKVELSGGLTRSSEEGAVMALERRGQLIQFTIVDNFKKKEERLWINKINGSYR